MEGWGREGMWEVWREAGKEGWVWGMGEGGRGYRMEGGSDGGTE